MTISSLLGLMDAVAVRRTEAFQTVIGIVRLDPASPLFQIISDGKCMLNQEHFRTLLEEAITIVSSHDVRRSVNDWPFEYFWGSRIAEPRHSKLLGFFIDTAPDKVGHQCGKPLLKRFLETIVPEHAFDLDQCSVNTEIKHAKFGQIDLLIKRQCGDADDFGIIVENKVNDARNADRQLQRYVSWLIDDEDFSPDQIYVRYLPLTPEKKADSDDVTTIQRRGVNFREISFKDHILRWLEAVTANWPSDIDNAMCDNLSHYRNFIRYLVNNKYRKLKMNTDVLNRLKESDIDIPSLASGIEQLKASTEALDECLRYARIGALLIATRKQLERLGAESPEIWFCLEAEPFGKIEPKSHFDPCFYHGVVLCLAVNNQASVCFGSSLDAGWWLGYMKRVDGDVQDELKRAARLESLDVEAQQVVHGQVEL